MLDFTLVVRFVQSEWIGSARRSASRPANAAPPATITAPCRRPVAARLAFQAQLALQAHGDAHTAAYTKRGERLLGIALLHFVQQSHQHACARRSDRMPERDCAAVYIYFSAVPAQILV